MLEHKFKMYGAVQVWGMHFCHINAARCLSKVCQLYGMLPNCAGYKHAKLVAGAHVRLPHFSNDAPTYLYIMCSAFISVLIT